MKYLLDMARIKSVELEKQNKLILQKTNEILIEWKNDYAKVFEVLRDKQKNIELYETEIEQKKSRIFSLEDKLLSVPILETKMKYLRDEFDRETKKMVGSYEAKLKELSDPYKISPNLVNYQNEKISEILKADSKNQEVQRELAKTISRQKTKEKEMNERIRKLISECEFKTAEIIKLNQKLAEKNRECQIANSKNNRSFLAKLLIDNYFE